MKLKEDLVRDLLLHVEEHATRPHSDLDLIDIDPWSADDIAYHVERLREAGLLNATIDKLPDDEDPQLVHVAYSVHSLTYEGHEMLGAVREEKHWRAIKKKAGVAGSATLRSLMKVAEAYLIEVITPS